MSPRFARVVPNQSLLTGFCMVNSNFPVIRLKICIFDAVPPSLEGVVRSKPGQLTARVGTELERVLPRATIAWAQLLNCGWSPGAKSVEKIVCRTSPDAPLKTKMRFARDEGTTISGILSPLRSGA